MVIYGDGLFVLNLCLDYCLLLCAAKIAGVPFVRLRLLVASLLGAGYALAVFLPGLAFLARGWVKLLMGFLLVLVAYGWNGRLPRLALVFAVVAAALGGGVMALCQVGDASLPQGVAATGGDFLAVMLVGSLGCAGLGALFRRRGSPHTYAWVTARLGERTAAFRALVDTGNALTDRSDRSVIVADWEVIANLLPGFCPGDAEAPGEGILRLSAECEPGRLTLLSYRSVGAESALLLALKPDSVTIDGKPRRGTLLAASPNRVSGDGCYQGLIGPD